MYREHLKTILYLHQEHLKTIMYLHLETILHLHQGKTMNLLIFIGIFLI